MRVSAVDLIIDLNYLSQIHSMDIRLYHMTFYD